jgi:hypothetical protein
MNSAKKTAAVAIITAGIVLTTTGFNSAKPSAPPAAPAPIVLHEATVISALQSKARIVAPTGKVAVSSHWDEDKWHGHRGMTMSVKGEVVLGIDTQDIDISVVDNSIKVRMPQPEIVSLDLPYDKVSIYEETSVIQKLFAIDIPDEQKQALYKEAKQNMRKDIANDNEVQAKAERQMEDAVSGLLLKINGVDSIQFE